MNRLLAYFIYYYWRDIFDPKKPSLFELRNSDLPNMGMVGDMLRVQRSKLINQSILEDDKVKRYLKLFPMDIADAIITIAARGTYEGYIPVMFALFSTENEEYVRRLKIVWDLDTHAPEEIKSIFRAACKEYIQDENTKEDYKGFFMALELSVYDMDFSSYESALAAAQAFYKKIEETDFQKMKARTSQS